MKGTTLVFTKNISSGSVDEFNNPVLTTQDVSVDDCLVAPIIEPLNIREQNALAQSRDQIRIHIPKTCTNDVSDSTVEWDGKTFRVDSDSVSFMADNTPTRWNRYFRAEHVDV